MVMTLGWIGLCLLAADCRMETTEWMLVWSDEFNYSGLPDSARWTYAVGGHGWGNNELQYYTERRSKNAHVSNGLLHIVAHHEPHKGRTYTSTRLTSRGLGDWKYGRFEVSARVPSAKGTWPAIWLMPSDWTFPMGGWPDVGEIDIMEHVGHDPGVIHSSAHSRRYNWQAGTQKTGAIEVPDATSAFHTYILEWSADTIRTFVDEQPVFVYAREDSTSESWPFDKPFSLIINVAVGGAWGGIVDSAAFPQSMTVDYVRVYQRDTNR